MCTAKPISSTVDIPTFIFSVEMEMFWIPVMFVCLISGECSFFQGKPTYTEAGCMEQLTPLVALLKEDVRVADFNGTCVAVQAI